MSLVGFSARNHPQQAVRDDVDDRRTPRAFFDPLHAKHRFTVDAAASDENALLQTYWTLNEDGLKQAWSRHRVWCNPPYSDIRPWVNKAWQEMYSNGCESVVMLLPANRCEQRWWQDCVESQRDRPAVDWVSLQTKFLPGRMRFDWPAGRVVPVKGDRPPFGLVLLTWATAPAQTEGEMSETVAVFNGEKMTRREIEIAREAFMRGGQFAFSKIREARIGVDYHRDGEWLGLIPEAARHFPIPTITRPRVMRDPHESGLRWTVRDGKIAIYDSDHIPCRSPSNERVALWASLLEDPNETVDDES